VTASFLVNVDVADLDTAVAFYTAAFELRESRRLGPDVAELLGGTAPLYLLRSAPGTPAFAGGPQRSYARHWTPVHLDFVVPSLEPALARAEAAGARREGAIREHAWGRLAVLADPFGNGLCLLQLVGRGYDLLATPRA
jgi:predicted enzyme related to lactoylglutathione lyase